MLSGGLHAGNVRDALSLLSPDAVDVSSGVEVCLGQRCFKNRRVYPNGQKTLK